MSSTTLSRGGACTVLRVLGKMPDHRDQIFADRLADQRFRTIESAASEEVSVGWVTPEDPSGESFAIEDLDGGVGAWLRVRVDKKALPAKWVALHVAAAEKAKGKKLTAKERRELKEDLADHLLPRVLPTVTFVDALLWRDRVFLFSGSRSSAEAFATLWWLTFGASVVPLGPRALADVALGAKRATACDGLDPVRWPVNAVNAGGQA